MILRRTVAGLLLTGLAGGITVVDAQTPAAPATPTLAVMITVDQLRPKYLERFRPQLTGGFRRLLRGGAVFPDGVHDHATTETAPGHASILSGRFPRSTGIVRNNAGIQDVRAPLIGGPGQGASPFRFRGSTLVDWLRLKDQRARALSVSYKDRGAILPIGRLPEDVYWYSAHDGRFTTSTYYRDTLPSWVRRFNAERRPQRLAGAVWAPLRGDTAFSYTLPNDTARAVAAVPGTPWMDEMTLDLALAGIHELQLGVGPQTDVLAISLSAMDLIGHRFGPVTKEVNDHLFRLDRALGVFFDSLFATRDSSRVVVALTSDHGVAPLPERHFVGKPPGYGRTDLSDLVEDVDSALSRRGADSSAFDFEYGMMVLDRGALGRARVPADSLLDAFVAEARRRQGVLRVDKVADLTRRDTVRDVIARRWYHSLPPDLPVEAVVTLQPHWYWANITYATHGTPHDYDAKVPIIFYGPPFRPGRQDGTVRVVDIAPTLAHVLRVRPTETLDGRVLHQAIR
jgi:predicted AlkP superfamily pyrophosphatase or phosphodiesterase